MALVVNETGAAATNGLITASLAEIGSANAPKIRDVVPELNTFRQSIRVYDEMANNDAAIDVSLRASKIPILGADYFIEPASSEAEDIAIASFIEYNLFEGMTSPFLSSIDEMLRCFDYGFSVLEPVYENREWVRPTKGANRRTYTMLKKLAPRPATTIKEFKYDANGGPSGLIQNAFDETGKTREVTIPINKLVIFTLNKKGGNVEGKSILRTSHKHWFYKDTLYKIDAIQKERHGIGVPYVQLPLAYTDSDVTTAKTLVANIRTNEEAGFVIPPGYEMGFKKPEGELVDVMRSIEHHNGMILMNVMAQFLLMGIQEAGGGGRATSSTHQATYEKSLQYVAGMICQMITMYVIRPLVLYNFRTDRFPRLSVRSIGDGKELQQWASSVANLVSQGAIEVDHETEQWIRRRIDAPLRLTQRGENVETATTDDDTTNPTGKGGVQQDSPTSGTGNTGAA